MLFPTHGLRFLAENSAGWQSLQPDALLADIGGLPPGLAAWASAARLLRSAGLRVALPGLAAAEEEPKQAEKEEGQEGAEKAEGEEEGGANGEAKAAAEGEERKEEGEAKPAEEAAAASSADAEAGAEGRPPRRQLLPAAPSPERLAAAREAATQLYDTLRHTVKPDTVIVLPVVPAAPPRRRSAVSTPEGAAFEALTHCFNSLASLAQCPVVVVPLGTVADGTPLAAALMGGWCRVGEGLGTQLHTLHRQTTVHGGRFGVNAQGGWGRYDVHFGPAAAIEVGPRVSLTLC